MGLAKEAEYSPWYSMVARCTRPDYSGYSKYGGAGITVHAAWTGPDGFVRFVEHIGHRPSKVHQIDRIDGTKGYMPGNVRWATPTEQNRNRKDNVLLTYDGETLCMSEWAERLGIRRQSLHKRLAQWSVAEALSRPRRAYRAALAEGEGGR